jgi:small-conductance mechanosensitive channel
MGWLALLLFCLASARVASADERALEGAPLEIANRLVVTLRGPIAGYTGRERVTAARARIDGVLKRVDLPEVTTEEVPEGTRLLVGGELAFTVTRADIDPTLGETTSNVAGFTANRLRQAIVELRVQQTPRFLARAVAFSVLATVLFGLALWLLGRTRARLTSRFSGVAARHGKKLQVEGVGLLEASGVEQFAQRCVSLLVWLLRIAASVAWLAFVLEQFPYTHPWGAQLVTNLAGMLGQIGGAVVSAMPGLFFVAVIVLLARSFIQATGIFFERVQQGRVHLSWLDEETARPTRRIFNVVVWLFALTMAYPYLPGSGSEAFKGLSVLVGVMVSLGGSSVIGRAAAGLTLMYSAAFRRGDYVRIGETEGTVTDVGMFSTQLRTGLGESLNLPNSLVVAMITKNYSRAAAGTAYLVDTTVTIGYATPWRQVEAMLLEAARRTSVIAPEPAAFVRQTALSDFYVEYRLAAFVASAAPPPRLTCLNELHANIQDVFNEYGVQIMSPHYEADPGAPQVVPKKQWFAAPAHAANGNDAGPAFEHAAPERPEERAP